jgi:hypothetical protein
LPLEIKALKRAGYKEVDGGDSQQIPVDPDMIYLTDQASMVSEEKFTGTFVSWVLLLGWQLTIP